MNQVGMLKKASDPILSFTAFILSPSTFNHIPSTVYHLSSDTLYETPQFGVSISTRLEALPSSGGADTCRPAAALTPAVQRLG